MLYEILFMIMCLLTPILSLFTFLMGMKVGKEEKISVSVIEKPLIRRKKPKMTAEQEKLQTILANIDRYDGTSNGQIEV